MPSGEKLPLPRWRRHQPSDAVGADLCGAMSRPVRGMFLVPRFMLLVLLLTSLEYHRWRRLPHSWRGECGGRCAG